MATIIKKHITAYSICIKDIPKVEYKDLINHLIALKQEIYPPSKKFIDNGFNYNYLHYYRGSWSRTEKGSVVNHITIPEFKKLFPVSITRKWKL